MIIVIIIIIIIMMMIMIIIIIITMIMIMINIEFVASVYTFEFIASVHTDEMNSIVKLSLYVTLSHYVLLYFKCNGHLSMYSFSSSPRRRFNLQTEISGKYILLFFFIS